MGVYVKDMEMPENCDDCWALDEYGDYPRCRITEEQRGYNFRIREQRMEHCPLIEVPTPHGRLIDMDGLIKDAYKMRYGVGWLIPVESIEAVPTIIEAAE